MQAGRSHITLVTTTTPEQNAEPILRTVFISWSFIELGAFSESKAVKPDIVSDQLSLKLGLELYVYSLHKRPQTSYQQA